jgi:hypothetical protein
VSTHSSTSTPTDTRAATGVGFQTSVGILLSSVMFKLLVGFTEHPYRRSKRQKLQTDHSTPYNSEVKNAWSLTSNIQYVFMHGANGQGSCRHCNEVFLFGMVNKVATRLSVPLISYRCQHCWLHTNLPAFLKQHKNVMVL